MKQGYSFVGDNTSETLIICWIIWYIIEAPNPHSFAMESVNVTFHLTLRCFNIHVKMCVLLRYCSKNYTSTRTVILRDGVCQNLSFQNIFGANLCTENLLHLKRCVLLTYSAVIKWVQRMCSNSLNSRGKPAVSPMSGAPTFDNEKK